MSSRAAHSRPARPDGTERLPRPGRRTWLGALGLALAVGLGLLARLGVERLAAQPWLAVRSVRIDGVSRADPDELLARAGVVAGDRWIGLPLEEIRFRLEGHPWVRDASIRRPWAGLVRIRIKERTPLARVRVKGVAYGVAEDLRILPRLAPADSLLPEIRGELDGGALSRGLEYAQALCEVGIAGREPLELSVSGEPPDRIELPRRGFSARIEPLLQPREAVRNVAAFLETLDGEGEFRGTLRLISADTAVWKAW